MDSDKKTRISRSFNLENTDTPTRWYHRCVWYLHNLSVITSMFACLGYWALFDDGDRCLWNLYIHGGAAVTMVADTLLVRLPSRFGNCAHFSLMVMVYAAFNWLLSVTGTAKRVYAVVDWDLRPGAATGLFVATAVVGGLLGGLAMMSLYCVRMWLFTKLRGGDEVGQVSEKIALNEKGGKTAAADADADKVC